MLGIIGGTSLLYADLPDLEKTTIATPFGPAEVHLGDVAFVDRHQFNRPPHRINYRACIAALAIQGVDRVVAFCSVGSLKKEIVPGSIVIPHDFFSPVIFPTIHENAIGHVMPSIDPDLRKRLSDIIPDAIGEGVYVQVKGPRFETPSEIRAFARCGDLIGMTLASEATVANELDIPFAAVCTVDNYGNGIADNQLSYEFILEKARKNKEKVEKIFGDIIRELS